MSTETTTDLLRGLVHALSRQAAAHPDSIAGRVQADCRRAVQSLEDGVLIETSGRMLLDALKAQAEEDGTSISPHVAYHYGQLRRALQS